MRELSEDYRSVVSMNDRVSTKHSFYGKSSIPHSVNSNKAEEAATEPREIEGIEKDPEAVVSLSRVSYVPPDPITVPRAHRRGLFGRFSILAEVEDARNYKNSVKWYITFIIGIAGIAAPLASTIILPALPEIAMDFETKATETNLAVALYMLAMAVFPLWWSSFSETLGRRTIYLVSFSMFILWNICGAVSTNIGMLVVMRLLGGGASASVQAVGAGTIADVWEPKERGKAMGFFYLGPLMGPFIAPIMGGALTESLGWRSTQWALVIYGFVVLAFLFFALPETLKVRTPVSRGEDGLMKVSSRQSAKQNTKRLVKGLKRSFLDPLKIILYLRFPAVAVTVFYGSITFGTLYLFNVSLETTFSATPYSYSTIIVGLTYIPGSLGYFLASMFGGKWTDTIMAREAAKAKRFDEKGKLIYRPEDRMRENAWIAAIMYPAALIWYGWTSERGVSWPAPLIANFFYGIGSMLIFAMATTMLTEFMPKNASAGVAANNFVRNILSCVAAVTAGPLIGAIGNGWLFTGVGVITLISGAVSVWAMKRFGERWKESMARAMEEQGL